MQNQIEKVFNQFLVKHENFLRKKRKREEYVDKFMINLDCCKPAKVEVKETKAEIPELDGYCQSPYSDHDLLAIEEFIKISPYADTKLG